MVKKSTTVVDKNKNEDESAEEVLKNKLESPIEEITKDSEELKNQQQQRQGQWGQQYDVWLIRRARKQRIVDFLLELNWPGENPLISAIPVRIDKDAVQVVIGSNDPFWIMKSNIKIFRESDQNPSAT